jgi:hydrogenase 3 maturation protease
MVKDSEVLAHLRSHLKGKTIILGIGNTLKGDDGIGSILAARIKGKVPYTVYDAGPGPENYLGKIVKDKPDNVVILDAVDFGASPGEFNIFEVGDLASVNFFATHDASISLAINYLQNNLKVDIIILAVQPKGVVFGEKLSQEANKALEELEGWFRERKEKG